MTEIQNIPLGMIFPNPEQPRKRFDPQALDELAGSIKEHGVIQPVEVEERNGVYILHDGECRWRASKIAGKETIPAIVQPSLNGSGPETRLVRALVANIQRNDMNPMDEANGYLRLIQQHGYSVRKVSQKIGKGEAHVQNRLALTELDPEIQELVSSGQFTSHSQVAREIVKIDDKAARIKLAKSLAERKLTIKGCLAAIRQLNAALRSRPINAHTPSLRLAAGRSGTDFDEEQAPSGWNMLQSAGQLPPWDLVSKVAVKTCEECELRGMASEEVCSPCPAVAMLRLLAAEVVRVR